MSDLDCWFYSLTETESGLDDYAMLEVIDRMKTKKHIILNSHDNDWLDAVS